MGTTAMKPAERLARAVLLFHRGGPWTDDDRAVWEALTGSTEATTVTLCDVARSYLATAKIRSLAATVRWLRTLAALEAVDGPDCAVPATLDDVASDLEAQAEALRVLRDAARKRGELDQANAFGDQAAGFTGAARILRGETPDA
jgi:hypothetical protein